MFVAEFLAVGKRSAFRSLPGAALRSALGCKNVAAAGGASAVGLVRELQDGAAWVQRGLHLLPDPAAPAPL